MTDLDQLYQLHSRLILDTAQAFTGDIIAGVKPTPAGIAWHCDHDRYLHLWRTIKSDHFAATGWRVDIPKALKQRFGYILEDEIPDEPEPTTSPTSAIAQTLRVKAALEAMRIDR